jgi:hypothetical protein
LRRIKAGTNQIENAAESQIIPDYLSKKLSMIFRGIISRGEIRDRETRLLDTKACAGANPILGGRGMTRRQDDSEQEQEFVAWGQRSHIGLRFRFFG